MLCTYKLAWILNSLFPQISGSDLPNSCFQFSSTPLIWNQSEQRLPQNLLGRNCTRSSSLPRWQWTSGTWTLNKYFRPEEAPASPSLAWSPTLFSQFLEQTGAAGFRGPLWLCPAGQAPAGFSSLVLDQSQIPSTKAGAASLLLLCPGLIPIYPNWVDVVYLHSLGNPTAVPVFARQMQIRETPYFMQGDSLFKYIKNLSDPWLNWVNIVNPASKSITWLGANIHKIWSEPLLNSWRHCRVPS